MPPECPLRNRRWVDLSDLRSEPIRILLPHVRQERLGELADAGVDKLEGTKAVLMVEKNDLARSFLNADRITSAVRADHPIRNEAFLIRRRPLSRGRKDFPDRCRTLRLAERDERS